MWTNSKWDGSFLSIQAGRCAIQLSRPVNEIVAVYNTPVEYDIMTLAPSGSVYWLDENPIEIFIPNYRLSEWADEFHIY